MESDRTQHEATPPKGEIRNPKSEIRTKNNAERGNDGKQPKPHEATEETGRRTGGNPKLETRNPKKGAISKGVMMETVAKRAWRSNKGKKMQAKK